MQGAHTQYKTVGVQWFASICFSRQRSCRLTRTQPENPTVSYCQPLEGNTPLRGLTAERYTGVTFFCLLPSNGSAFKNKEKQAAYELLNSGAAAYMPPTDVYIQFFPLFLLFISGSLFYKQV